MAESKTTTAKKVEEEREIFVPKDMDNSNGTWFCSINGVNYRVPVGKRTKVPMIVAEHFDIACNRLARLDETIEKLKPKDDKGL